MHPMPILGEPAVTSAQFAPLRFSQAARSSRAAFDLTGMQQGFRLRLGDGVPLRLRSRRLSVCAPLFPFADRRLKPGSLFSANHPALFGIPLQ